MIMLALIAVGVIAAALFLWKLDCDLTLAWSMRFGKPAESLAGKVVWVTGSSSGIGEALAQEFAKVGCKLVLSARREELLKGVKQKCLELSRGKLRDSEILVLRLDLLQYETHADATEQVMKYFKRIDILVNNAGRSQRSLITDTPLEVDRQVIDLDLLAPISVTKAVLPHMIKQGQGHILCTSSVAGKLGAPGSGIYSSAKHGLQGFFDTLRIELATQNIGVTMACPGPVYSEALLHAFTDTPGKTLGIKMGENWGRMSAARCAQLMVAATANELHEAWITPNPELFYCFLFQYMPFFAKKIATKLGQGRANKVKAGDHNLH